jgi:hypothetical protein
VAVLRLTIDTSLVIHSVQGQHFAAEVDELVEFARAGLVDLSLTTAFEVDQERAMPVYRAQNLDWLSQHPMIARVLQVACWDYSDWGGGSAWGADDSERVNAELEKIVLRPQYQVGSVDVSDPAYMQKWRRAVTDVQHLLAHHASGNDAFVTSDDDDMVKKKDAIRMATGIVTYGVPEAVQVVRSSTA